MHVIEGWRVPKKGKNDWSIFIVLLYSLRENNEILSFLFQFNRSHDNLSLYS